MATQVASLFARVGADTTSYDRAMRGVDSKLHSVGGAFRGLGGVITDVFKVGAVAAVGTAVVGIGAMTAAIGKSIQISGDLEQQVANIAAVWQLNQTEAGKVKDLINRLGINPNLKVSAEEAGQAIEILAKNGLSLEQVLGGAAESVVLLQNATGTDFATASDIGVQAMSLFGIEAENLGAAVNQMVGFTNASKFGIEDYKYILADAAPVLSKLGVGFDEFNALMAVTSARFASGMTQGTSFKTMFTRLIPQTNEAADAMRSVGLYSGLTADEFEKTTAKIADNEAAIRKLDPSSKNYAKRLAELTQKNDVLRQSLQRGKNAFFNADGSIKSTTEIVKSLNTAVGGMSQMDQVDILTKIFGTEGAQGALAMLGLTEEQLASVYQTIGNTDALDQAEIRTDTLNSKWETFKDTLTTWAGMVGDKFNPAARGVVEWLTGVANTYGPAVVDMFGQFAGLISNIGQYLGATMQDGNYLNGWLSVMPENLRGVVLELGRFTGALRDIGIAFQNGGVGAAMGEIGEQLGWMAERFRAWATGLWENSIKPGISSAFGNLVTFVTSPSTLASIGAALLAWGNTFAQWALALWNNNVWPNLLTMWTNLVTWVTDVRTWGQIWQALTVWGNTFATWVTGLWLTYIQPGMDDLRNKFWGKGGWIETNVPVMQPWYDALTTFIGAVKTEWGLQFPAVAEKFTTWKTDMGTALGEFATVWAGVFGSDGKPGSAADAAKKTVEVITQALTGMMDGSLGLVKWATNIGKVVQLLKQLVDAIDKGDWGRAGDLFNQIDKIPVTGGNFFNPLNPLAPTQNPNAPFFGQGASNYTPTTGANGRVDLYVHNGAGMPTDRESLRQMAVALRKELDLRGAVMVR